MKVRVLKEMPFAKVGEVLPMKEKWIEFKQEPYDEIQFDSLEIAQMITDGWLEEVITN